MGAFNGAVATATGSHGGPQDAKGPALGSLSVGAMTSPGALAGTTGTEASLIHGDTWNQMAGNQMENILVNQTVNVTSNQTINVGGWQHFTVSGDEVHKVLSNLTYRVNGKSNDTRVGVHNQTNVSPRNDEFCCTRSELHHQPENREQKTEDVDHKNKVMEFIKEHFLFEWFKCKLMIGPEVTLNPVLSYEFVELAMANKTIGCENVRIECEFKELKTALGLVADEIKGLKTKVAPLHAKAVGLNANAGAAVNGDSPMG